MRVKHLRPLCQTGSYWEGRGHLLPVSVISYCLREIEGNEIASMGSLFVLSNTIWEGGSTSGHLCSSQYLTPFNDVFATSAACYISAASPVSVRLSSVCFYPDKFEFLTMAAMGCPVLCVLCLSRGKSPPLDQTLSHLLLQWSLCETTMHGIPSGPGTNQRAHNRPDRCWSSSTHGLFCADADKYLIPFSQLTLRWQQCPKTERQITE